MTGEICWKNFSFKDHVWPRQETAQLLKTLYQSMYCIFFTARNWVWVETYREQLVHVGGFKGLDSPHGNITARLSWQHPEAQRILIILLQLGFSKFPVSNNIKFGIYVPRNLLFSLVEFSDWQRFYDKYPSMSKWSETCSSSVSLKAWWLTMAWGWGWQPLFFYTSVRCQSCGPIHLLRCSLSALFCLAALCEKASSQGQRFTSTSLAGGNNSMAQHIHRRNFDLIC